MTLHRFLLIAFLIFSLGILALYTGLNRAPLRQMNHNTPHEHGHSSQLQSDTTIVQERS